MRLCRCFLVLLLTATAWCGDYQVVLKNSGKVIHGDLLYEDAHTVTLQVGGGAVSFKKDRLDLERMRELNRAAPSTPSTASAPHQSPPPHEVGLASIRKLEGQITEREEALARLRAQPPSDERDRKIQEGEEELRLMRSAREDLKLESGVSQDPELVRLFKLRAEAFNEAEQAQRAFDSLPPDAPQSEVDAKWQAFRDAEKKWQAAHAALTTAMEQRR